MNNKNYFWLFLTLIIFLFCTSCSSNRVMINRYVLSNTSLVVSFVIIDDKGKIYDGKKELNISEDIKSLSFLINIKNPERLGYQIWLEKLTENKNDSKKLYVANTETGKTSYRVRCMLDEKKASFIVSFRNLKDQILFELLPLEYQVQQKKEIERG